MHVVPEAQLVAPLKVEPPHCSYAPAEPPVEPPVEGGVEVPGVEGLDVGAAVLALDVVRVSVVLLGRGADVAPALVLDGWMALALAAAVVVAATVVLAEAEPLPVAEAEPPPAPLPAAPAEPVEVTAEVVCAIDEAPLYRVGPGTW